MNKFKDLIKIASNIINHRRKGDFSLKNKDTEILSFSFNDFGKAEIIEVYSSQIPNFILNNFSNWVASRKPPKHREFMLDLFSKLGLEYEDTKSILEYSKGLSLTDTLWITEDNTLKWNDVSLYRNEFSDVISNFAFTGFIEEGDIAITSPEFTTNGNLAKCWVKENNGIYLYKRGSSDWREPGYEPYSEGMASQIYDKLNLNHVHYDVVKYKGNLASRCELITDERVSIMPLYYFTKGTTKKAIYEFLDYHSFLEDFSNMNLVDYLILNSDRHLGNYSVLLDSDTFSILGFAPVYDNGRGCLYGYKADGDVLLQTYIKYHTAKFEENLKLDMETSIENSSVDWSILKDFKFDKEKLLDCPKEHIEAVESFIQDRLSILLRSF